MNEEQTNQFKKIEQQFSLLVNRMDLHYNSYNELSRVLIELRAEINIMKLKFLMKL
jgi:hypothetical protein